jgi:hypothetical protein
MEESDGRIMAGFFLVCGIVTFGCAVVEAIHGGDPKTAMILAWLFMILSKLEQ